MRCAVQDDAGEDLDESRPVHGSRRGIFESTLTFQPLGNERKGGDSATERIHKAECLKPEEQSLMLKE
jgi:hypothetical protein